MLSKNKFTLVFTTVASLILLVVVILNLFFRFMDISPYLPQIEQRIEKAIKRKVSIGNARLSFINGLDIILENVTIQEKGKKENFITSDRFIVSFYLLPLLEKHIAIKEVQIISPRVQVYRSREGETNLMNWINEIIPDQFFSDIREKETGLPIMKKLMIKNGYLAVRDMQVSKTPLVTKISNFDLELGRSFMSKSIVGLIKGEIQNGDEPAIFRIETEIQKMEGNLTLENLVLKGNIKLSSLNVNQFQPYFKKFSWVKKWNSKIDLDTNYDGSFAWGFKLVGETEFKSLGSSQIPALSDPQKAHQWGLDYDLFWDKNKLDIHEFRIKSSDLILTGKSLVEAPFSNNPYISFEFKSTPFDLKSFLNDISLSLLPAPLHTFYDRVIKGKLTFESIKFKGNFNQLKNIHQVENFKLLSGEINTDKIDIRIGSDGVVAKKITGIIEFNGDTVKLSNMVGTYKKSEISKLSGEISKPFEDPEIDLSVQASLQLEQVIPILSSKLSFLKDIRHYRKINNVSGRAEIQTHLSGKVKKPLQLKYSGNVEFKNVAFNHDDLVHRFSNINGKASFYSQYSSIPGEDSKNKGVAGFLKKTGGNNSKKEKIFYIANLSGKYGRSEIMNITGGIMEISTRPVFSLKVDLDLLLNEIHPIFVTYLNANDVFEDMNNINIISGRSRVKALINHNLPGITKWDFSGGLQLEDVYVSHNKLPLILSKMKGNIVFTKDELEWKNLHGLVGKSTFNVNGKTLAYASKNPKVDLQLNGDAYLKEIFNILASSGNENFHSEGIARVKLKFNGDYYAMATIGELDLTQSSYQYKRWVDKKRGRKNTVYLEGSLEKLNNFYLKKFEAAYEGTKIFGEGTILDLRKSQHYLDIKINTADLELSEILNDKLISGKLSTSFNIKGNLKDKKQLKIEGKAAVNNGSYKFDFSPNPIKNINAKFGFNGQKITIKNLALSVGKSDANIKGEIIGFDKPVFTLRLKSKNLDFNQLLPEDIKSINEINSLIKSSPLFLLTRGTIKIDAEKGEFNFLKFPHVTGKIQLKYGLIMLNHVNIFFNKKYVSANVLLDFLSDNGLDFSLNLHGKSLQANEFEGVFGNYFKDSTTGRLSFSTNLAGKGSNLEQISRSLNGNLSLLLLKGDYNKQNLISGISQVLGFESEKTESDLPQALSTEFDLIKGSFAIKDGVAKTENYVIETPERRTSVVGSLDLGNEKLDLSIGVAPWKNLNKTVSKIPIVGTILTGGDDKSLLTNYYSVKGKMADPEVKAVPLKSLGKKVISLFKGFIQTPKEIFAPAK